MDDFWIVVSVFGGITVVAIIYLIILFASFINDYEFRLGRNQLYQGIITVLKNNKEDGLAVSEIHTLYKENSKRNPKVFKKFPTISEILEDLIYNLNTVPEEKWKRIFKVEYLGDYRIRLINITSMIKKKNPYNSYTGRNIGKIYKLLEDTQLNNESKNALQELIDDLEVYEYQDRDGYKLSKKSFYYSIIFGIVGLLGTIYTFVSPLF